MTCPLVAISLACKAIAVLLWFLGYRWVAVVFFFGPDFFLLYALFVPSAQGLGPVITRFQTDRKEVWLTIDDGPDEQDTPRILDLIDRYGAKATFFVIGERAARHPDLVAEIKRRGNEVAHHTQTHPVALFWCASRFRVRRELDDALKVLAGAGIRPRWFRSPVGIKNIHLSEALKERQLAAVAWSVRGCDTVCRDPERVKARIMRGVKPGAILLVHEGAGVSPRVRIRAIEGVLSALKASGYACVLPDPGQMR